SWRSTPTGEWRKCGVRLQPDITVGSLMAHRVAVAAPHAGKSAPLIPCDDRASSGSFETTSAARLKTSAVTRDNQNALTEDARMNRCADFQLRGVLGMVAGARHAACHQLLRTKRPFRDTSSCVAAFCSSLSRE